MRQTVIEKLSTEIYDFWSDILGDHLVNFPMFSLNGRQGKTDYIDFLEPKDLPGPISCGFDINDRFFISFSLSTYRSGSLTRNVVFTVFQRYSNVKNFFSSGIRGHSEELLDNLYFTIDNIDSTIGIEENKRAVADIDNILFNAGVFNYFDGFHKCSQESYAKHILKELCSGNLKSVRLNMDFEYDRSIEIMNVENGQNIIVPEIKVYSSS